MNDGGGRIRERLDSLPAPLRWVYVDTLIDKGSVKRAGLILAGDVMKLADDYPSHRGPNGYFWQDMEEALDLALLTLKEGGLVGA